MNNFIDFESYNFQGEERLAAAAIGGLYAMIVTGGISDCESLKEDFKNLTSKDDPTRINAEVVRKILTEALDQMDKAVDSWNPGSEMMKGAKKTLQSADIDPESIISDMSLDFARFISDLSMQAAA